jgi:hypothetical protein
MLTCRHNRQKEMDFVAAQMMRRHNKLLSMIGVMILAYDIVCQWSIHWEERFDKAWSTLGKHKPEYLKLLKAIGSWHVHGHLAECLARYGFQWIFGAGQTDGELVETLWAYLNALSRTARAMTKAHREECLNDGLNAWNMKKILNTGMVASLLIHRRLTLRQWTAWCSDGNVRWLNTPLISRHTTSLSRTLTNFKSMHGLQSTQMRSCIATTRSAPYLATSSCLIKGQVSVAKRTIVGKRTSYVQKQDPTKKKY